MFPQPPTNSLDQAHSVQQPHHTASDHSQGPTSSSSGQGIMYIFILLLALLPFYIAVSIDMQFKSQYPSGQVGFTDHPYNTSEFGEEVTYYRSQMTVTLPGQQPMVVGDSHKYFINTELSRKKAAHDAIPQLTHQQGGISLYNYCFFHW